MKRGLFVAILCGLLIFGVAASSPNTSLAAEPEASERTLSVTGQGRLDVTPDTAVITIGVSELKSSPTEAYSALSTSINKISEGLKAEGVKEEQIQTSIFSLNAEYTWTQDKGQVFTGYRATNTLSITTQDLNRVADLIQVAVDAGANDLRGVSFSVKDSDKLLEQALDLAVDDAKAKAERVAGRMGAKVARVQSISIQDQGLPMYRNVKAEAGMVAMDAAAAPVPVYAGTNSFTASVYVVFELQ